LSSHKYIETKQELYLY